MPNGNDEQTRPEKDTDCECGRWARKALGREQARVGRLRKEIAMLREIVAGNGCEHEIPQPGESTLEKAHRKALIKERQTGDELSKLQEGAEEWQT